MRPVLLAAGLLLAASLPAQTVIAPGVIRYGDEDCLNTGCFGGANPKAGATLTGLAPGAVTSSGATFAHAFPFSPAPGDWDGTDRIYVSSVQSATGDGYSASPLRRPGPHVLLLPYAPFVPAGHSVVGLTLGLMLDDFQFPTFGQAYVGSINGVQDAGLTALLNGIDQTGPRTRFYTYGVNPALLTPNGVLAVTINQAAPGRDGWAIDFATVGLVTAATTVPEPGTWMLLGTGLAALGAVARRRARAG